MSTTNETNNNFLYLSNKMHYTIIYVGLPHPTSCKTFLGLNSLLTLGLQIPQSDMLGTKKYENTQLVSQA